MRSGAYCGIFFALCSGLAADLEMWGVAISTGIIALCALVFTWAEYASSHE